MQDHTTNHLLKFILLKLFILILSLLFQSKVSEVVCSICSLEKVYFKEWVNSRKSVAKPTSAVLLTDEGYS